MVKYDINKCLTINLRYEIEVTEDTAEDTGGKLWVITSSQIPELLSWVYSEKDIEKFSRGAVEESIAGRMYYKEDAPIPIYGVPFSKYYVTLSAEMFFKVELYMFIKTRGLTEIDLTKSGNLSVKQVKDILDPDKKLNPQLLDIAFEEIGFPIKRILGLSMHELCENIYKHHNASDLGVPDKAMSFPQHFPDSKTDFSFVGVNSMAHV